MALNIPEDVHGEIKKYAILHKMKKVVLFGSRARGTNRERSDIDIFAVGGDVDSFRAALDEEADTLLMFDVVDAGANVSDELKAEIEKDGVVIYEKV
nr:nucleotidyltransferase domain-containing protein [Treponema sp.]